ncbi:FadR/GntR family transcriptional regulator [Roseomonas sp. AR75]|jgi:DNA-binding FadR family transcriptional regulator|uniref:FadR/GntR family transcriptional regulator n=1 Tax=Roseomonas sp. AR75 TaxID=2562311 RepID=UPI0010BF8039|nr:FCD domain-containing protein [Roseomonas sp. AR75]
MHDSLALLRSAVSRRTMREQITDRLAGMILSGLLRPGDALPGERDLAAQLDVSRETVRGAIQALAARGLVEVAQGARSRVLAAAHWIARPAPVARYTPEEVQGARLVLEVAAARDAARNADATTRERLTELVDEQGRALDDPAAFHICGSEFHATLQRAGGNRLLAALLAEAYGQSSELSHRALAAPGAMRRSWLDHKRIAAAIAARDPDGAAAAMRQHLDRLGKAAKRAGEKRDAA